MRTTTRFPFHLDCPHYVFFLKKEVSDSLNLFEDLLFIDRKIKKPIEIVDQLNKENDTNPHSSLPPPLPLIFDSKDSSPRHQCNSSSQQVIESFPRISCSSL